jgi:hypothetical protein
MAVNKPLQPNGVEQAQSEDDQQREFFGPRGA